LRPVFLYRYSPANFAALVYFSPMAIVTAII